MEGSSYDLSMHTPLLALPLSSTVVPEVVDMDHHFNLLLLMPSPFRARSPHPLLGPTPSCVFVSLFELQDVTGMC